jgi:hypothetical protein
MWFAILITFLLAQAEELLKSQGTTGPGGNIDVDAATITSDFSNPLRDFGLESSFTDPDDFVFNSTEIDVQALQTSSPLDMFPQSTQDNQTTSFLTEDFSWAMIELGVQEPLPPQDTIDELYVPIHPIINTD